MKFWWPRAQRQNGKFFFGITAQKTCVVANAQGQRRLRKSILSQYSTKQTHAQVLVLIFYDMEDKNEHDFNGRFG